MSEVKNPSIDAILDGTHSLPPPDLTPDPPANEPSAPEPTPTSEPAPQPAAVEPTPAPTPEPAPAPQAPDPEKPNKLVPLAALHEERERRRELQEELRQERLRQQKLEETWLEVQKRMTAQAAGKTEPEKPETPPPDYNQDPAGFLKWQQEQLLEKQTEIDRWREQQAQLFQQQQAQQQFAAVVTGHENQFRQQAPDYDRAVDFLKSRRDQELRAWGIANPVQRAQVIQQEISFLASAALQSGESPAAKAYEMARRWGWGQQTPAATPPAPTPGPVAPNPAPTAPAPAPVPTTAAPAAPAAQLSPNQLGDAERLALAQRGQQAAKSLANVGGSEAPSNLTLQQLADITDPEEFDRRWEQMFGRSRFF